MVEDLKSTTHNTEEISLKELILKTVLWFKFLLSKWLIILIIGLIGGAAGLGYAFLKKTTYTAVTNFVLEEDKAGAGGLGSLAGIASMAGVDLNGGGSIFQGDNILELYESRTMITKTLLSSFEFDGKKQLLIDRYIVANKLRESWDEKPRTKNVQFSATEPHTLVQDSLIGVVVKKILKNNLNVNRPDKKLSIINVIVNSNDEMFSKVFNDIIVANVNRFYIETKIKKSKINVAILSKQVDSVRQVMTGSIYSAARIADATPNLNPTRQVQRIAPIQKSQFSAETNKAILAELLKNLELSKISLRKEEPLIQVIDTPIYPLDNDKLGKLKAICFGGLIAGFLAVIFLILKKNLKDIISE